MNAEFLMYLTLIDVHQYYDMICKAVLEKIYLVASAIKFQHTEWLAKNPTGIPVPDTR